MLRFIKFFFTFLYHFMMLHITFFYIFVPLVGNCGVSLFLPKLLNLPQMWFPYRKQVHPVLAHPCCQTHT